MNRSVTLATLALAGLATPDLAQSNSDPTIDVRLGALSSLTQMGRVGNFPNGTTGLSMSTTSCNKGTSVVPWLAPMNPDHPFISFLVARDDGVRFQQISDRSYVKHGFFALEQNLCDVCQGGDPVNGTFLGLGCADTYTASTNGNRLFLGPPDEIDPWLGTWDPVCSFFDMGDPPVAPPQDCDGFRSLDTQQANAYNGIQHRVEVLDSRLVDNGPERFYYQAHYTVATEPEANRGDNTGWREFQPSWTGSSWSNANLTGLTYGSVLDGWDGADVSSNTNGADDGRLYVAVKVTGPVQGLYHYEYAVHNRDSARGVSQFRIPVCTDAVVLNAGFSDVDRLPNAWNFSRNAGELSWRTTDNPLGWNSIYNFWFDSDAAPIDGVNVALDAFLPGPGAATVAVSTRTPTGLYNVNLGAGCSLNNPPSLYAIGSPAQALLGNTTFGVESSGNAPATAVVFLFTPFPAQTPVGGGCVSFVASQLLSSKLRLADASGVARLPLPIPNDSDLEGVDVNFQLLELDPLGGPFLSDFDLSNGRRVRIGDNLPSCP